MTNMGIEPLTMAMWIAGGEGSAPGVHTGHNNRHNRLAVDKWSAPAGRGRENGCAEVAARTLMPTHTAMRGWG